MFKVCRNLIFLWLFFASIAHAELNLELPDFDLPEMGASTATISQDNDLGLQVIRSFRRQGAVIEDPELNSWIRTLGNRLASKAPRHGKLYFLIAKNSDVNAFATPGGVIVINTGLILNADTESEVAAVVAHEIAHITQNHLSRLLAKSKTNVLGTSAAILAGVIAGSQNPEAGSAIISTALAAQQHNQLSFSRGMEAEADRVGIRILAGAGFDPAGMPAFMNKLDQLSDDPYAQLTKYLRSHPLSIERVSDTRSRANRLGKRGKNDISFYYAREKIRALYNKGHRSQAPSLPTLALKKYSQAMSLMGRGQYNEALKLLGSASKYPPQAIAMAVSLNHTRQYEKTINLLTPLVKVRPGEQSLLIPLLNAYLGLGRSDEAWRYIRQMTPTEQTSLAFFEVKQAIANKKGYIADAYLSAVERNVRIGEFKHALAQLRQAIKQPGISAQDAARLQSKLNEVKQLAKRH